MNIFKLLEIGVELGASDIHITVDSPPNLLQELKEVL